MYKVQLYKSGHSDEELFENIKNVWKKLGRQPRFDDMNGNGSICSAALYIYRYGKWNTALELFSKYVGGEIIEKSKFQVNRKMNNSLRYDIMKRDNFKCILCGDSPAKNPKTRLEIDHETPLAKGGSNNEKNLRTLCLKCNQGKKDK